MKKRITSAVIAFVMMFGTIYCGPMTAYAAYEGEEWYDQITTVKVNREDAHAFFVPYQDAQTALDNEESVLTRDFSNSDFYQSLNGTWKFKAVDKPADRIDGFWNTDAATTSAVAGWDDMKVPSNWQLARNEDGSLKYDKPIYINVRYPWRTGSYDFTGAGGTADLAYPVKAPTDFNPVGHYRRTFEVPANWDGRETFISFDGVESAFYLWINGQKVGYAEDSFTASEFNITKYLQPGTNTIAVQVYRWSTGSYLENQDYFRLAGIFRDVYLTSKNKVELRDFFVKPDLDANFKNATLELEASVRNYGAATGKYTVEATLKNMDDSNVWAEPLQIPVNVTAAGTTPSRITVSGSKAVTAPRLWFADTPELYKLLIQLKDQNGTVVETAVSRVGFREVDRNTVVNANGNQIMSINGKRIMIRGVNRHEFSSVNGRALTKEEITTDLVNMKRNNINAIRTSHYPNAPYTYALAEEIGIYVCDEANVESHEGAQTALQNRIPGTTGSNPNTWTPSVLDRTYSMIEQHKNYQSIVIWSLGNEQVYYNLPALDQTNPRYPLMVQSQWIKSRDDSRLLKCERDNRSGLVDIRSNQYPGAGSARNTANQYSSSSAGGGWDHKLPYILSEYQHSMGNAGGGLNEYWKLFREVPQAQGGFIWDFIDQAIEMPTPEGSVNPDDANEIGKGVYMAYGGDFGERWHDNDFCNNGIMFADRTPKPIMNEVRYTHQEIWYTSNDANLALGKVNVSNEFLNTSLDQFNHKWYIIKDGVAIQNGDFALSTAPLAKEDITISDVATIVPEEGAEYFLKFEASLKEDTMWAEAGYVIATEQFKLPIAEESDDELDTEALPEFTEVTDTNAKVEVKGEDFTVSFDKTKAEITSIIKDGSELLKSGPVINHWRSMGSNDRTFNATFETSRWKDATNKTVSVDKDVSGKFVNISVDSTYANGAKNTTNYTLLGNGEIIVENTLNSNLSSYLLRIGMKMEMAAGYDNFTYYGQGPGENYSDRQAASEVGLYEIATQDVYTPYTRPQFYGNRMGVRWFSVTDDSGNGLMIDAKETVNAAASNYDEDEFGTGRIVTSLSANRIRHLYDAPKHEGAVVNIDLGQASIGSWGGWNGEIENASLGYPATGTYTYAYRIIPVTGETNAEKMAESKVDFKTQEVAPPEAIQVGDVVWAADTRIVNKQGTSGTNYSTTGIATNGPNFGTITNYDPKTIGLFFSENQSVPAGTNYINALDNPASAADEKWRGYIEVSVEADKADLYTLSLLGYINDDTRSYEATVNGLAQGVTATLGETLPSSTAGTPMKVLQTSVLLQEGANTIRVQAPYGKNAPNFIALSVNEDDSARAALAAPVEWVGSSLTANPNMDLS
ncbi:MAG: DUF4981 domain-containing protein, partial [Clostridiales bacterium]|nr:DUF4981 domain-containing protein [Clostridiales bacterium]